MVDAASPNSGGGFGGRWEKTFVQGSLGFGEEFQEFVGHIFLERGAGEEAELHCEAQYGCEYEGDSGPDSGRNDALPEGFDKKDDYEESEHQEKAVGDEDASACGAAVRMCSMWKGWEERAGEEDDQKEMTCRMVERTFFHSWFSR